MLVPNVTFKEKYGPDWNEVTSEDIFKDQRVVVVSLPGPFTPVCSSKQVPEFDAAFEELESLGIDAVYIFSVSDWFVMSAWFEKLGVKNLDFMADGSGEFTRDMDMLVNKPLQNFGMRSWRYAMVVSNMRIEKMFVEPDKNSRSLDSDPYQETTPGKIIEYLKSVA